MDAFGQVFGAGRSGRSQADFTTPDGVRLHRSAPRRCPGGYEGSVQYRGHALAFEHDSADLDDCSHGWTVRSTLELARGEDHFDLAYEVELRCVDAGLDVAFEPDPDVLIVYCATLALAQQVLDFALDRHPVPAALAPTVRA